MKKIFYLFLALVMILTLMLSLSSCGDDLIVLSTNTEGGRVCLDIDCSDIFSLEAGSIIKCKVVHIGSDDTISGIEPSFLVVEGVYYKTSDGDHVGKDGKVFCIYAPSIDMFLLKFKYNFSTSSWEYVRP